MKEESKKLIKQIAEMIDKNKNNTILISRNYDQFLEKVLTTTAEAIISFERRAEIK